jgi:hypothetical protein
MSKPAKGHIHVVEGATGPQGLQGIQGIQGIQGNTGNTGATGPAAWLPPIAFTSGIVAVVGPPATAVTYLGETYICTTPHTTTGSFVSGNWSKITSKGDTGVTGATGPAAWLPPTAFVSGIVSVVGPPATTVTYLGETYVCIVGHTTTSTFVSGNWQKVAQKGDTGATGNTGNTGATGPTGRPAGMPYTWSTFTVGTSLTSGMVGINSASNTAATALLVHETDALAIAQAAAIQLWDDSTTVASRATLRIYETANPLNYVMYRVTGVITDNGGWDSVPVAHVDHGGSLANGVAVTIEATRTGDVGATGTAATIAVGTVSTLAAGASATVANAGSSSAATFNFGIPQGATGPTGPTTTLSWNMDTLTADGNPGVGLLRFNNSTLASVTFLYASNLEAGGSNVQAWLTAFGNSTNTSTKGWLVVTQASDPTRFVAFTVGGTTVDGSGYQKIPVTYVAGNGPLTGKISVLFAPAGDKGADGTGGNTFGSAAAGLNGHLVAFTGDGFHLADGGAAGALANLSTINNGNWSGTALTVANGGTGSTTAAAARAALGVDGLTSRGDAAYTILAADRVVGITTAFTAARIFTLPAASAVNAGSRLRIVDLVDAGAVTATNTLTIQRAGADTIHGATSVVIPTAYFDLDLISDGTSRWAFRVPPVVAGGTGATTASAARTNLGLAIGAGGNVQAYDADLDAIAALVSAADKLPYATGAQAWALTTLTSFIRTLLDDADAATARATLSAAALTDGHGQCILTKSGANLLLSPKDGNRLIVNGVVCTVPDGGVTLAAPATNGTLYYIYALATSGAVSSLEASTTTHATSTTAGNKGVEIKSGDDTRTLVGMARTVSSAWVDSATQRFVRSWFNGPPMYLANFLQSSVNSTATSYAELHATQTRIEWLNWANEVVSFAFTGNAYANLSVAIRQWTSMGIDSTTAPEDVWAYHNTYADTNTTDISFVHATSPSEGYHYGTVLIKVSSSTGTWYVNSNAAGDRPTFKAVLNGI